MIKMLPDCLLPDIHFITPLTHLSENVTLTNYHDIIRLVETALMNVGGILEMVNFSMPTKQPLGVVRVLRTGDRDL